MKSHLCPETLLQNGKYRIIRFIKSGGFGCTYEAENTYFEERVAIKEFFVKDFCNRDESSSHITVGTQSMKELVGKLKSKFIAEAKALYKLKHPGIVHVSDVFEENGTAYYVMEYIDGCSLDVYLQQNGPLSEAEALGYICQVCEALKYVHAQNRLHLDIKPGNIMLANDSGKAILIDFGSAKQYDECNGENTSTLLGNTPGYAPPEQTNSRVTQFFPATDIYSLGATLYKLLTGITPLTSSERSSGDELEPLPDIISESTRKAVEQALLLPKLKRPQSIDEFLVHLDADPAVTDGEDNTDDVNVTVEEKGGEVDEPESDTTEIYGGKEPDLESEENSDKDVNDEDGGDTLIQSESDDQHNSQNSSDTPSQTSDTTEKPKKKSRRWLWWVLAVFVIIVAVVLVLKMTSDEPSVSGPTGYHQGYGYVDLGLPSGLKWATCNIGASNPWEYGNYYAWGETTTKSEYSRDSYTFTYYLNDEIGGESSRDAATANWGGNWRMPTAAELEELINKCDWTWTAIDGHRGYKVIGPNGNSIFLPSAGQRWSNMLELEGDEGPNSFYWSSTPSGGNNTRYGISYYLYFYDAGVQCLSSVNRFLGFSIRPVLED